MRIPFFYNVFNKEKKFLYIERAFRTKKEIIPLGSDCHTAYVLKKLHLRKCSLPFDFMGCGGKRTFEFVNNNIENNFKYYVKDLILNDKNIVTSKTYPYCTFIHFPKLIHDKNLQNKFQKRGKLFLKIIKENDIYFISNISQSALSSSQDVEMYIKDVYHFQKNNLKHNDTLHIYIRYDESLNENKELTDILFEKLNEIDKVFCVRYVRHNKKYPTWGNPRHYPKLLKSLNINIEEIFPKIYIKNS